MIPVTDKDPVKKTIDIKFFVENFPKSLKKLWVNEYPTVSGSFIVPPPYKIIEITVKAKNKRTPYLGNRTIDILLKFTGEYKFR